MNITYVVLVNCKHPLLAEFLQHSNGQNKTYTRSFDAQKVAKRINDSEGEGSARAVAL